MWAQRFYPAPVPIRVSVFNPGPWETNCYVVEVTDRAGQAHAWAIDAGVEPEAMIQHLRAGQTHGVRLEAIVLTHAHVDHIAGVADVRRAFPGVPVLLHESEREWLGDAEQNLSAFTGMPISIAPPDRLVRDGDTLRLGDVEFGVRHTPGHSPGGIALYCAAEKLAFVGDALFAGSIGRTDFPGCSFEQLEASIKAKLYTLPDETRIFPGHGPPSSIGREANSNPFVRR